MSMHLVGSQKSNVEPASQSTSSSHPLAERIRSEDFRLAYEQLPEYDVAESVVRLRRLRDFTQKGLASRMHTWQPVVARIEAGAANLRLSTLKKIGEALNARIHIYLEPAEYRFPQVPPWWECMDFGLATPVETGNFTLVFQGSLNVENVAGHLSIEHGPFHLDNVKIHRTVDMTPTAADSISGAISGEHA